MLSEVLTGTLVNTIAVTGRWIASELVAPRGRRSKRDVEIATWFDTYQLTDATPDLSGLPEGLTEDALIDAVESNEMQASLHELLSVRLTDAPETVAQQVKDCFIATFQYRFPAHSVTEFTNSLFEYYDSEICGLTGRLRGAQPALFKQLRDEAYNARVLAVLNAVGTHELCVRDRMPVVEETQYLARYKRHVSDFHGKLQPPDFERRQRIPIRELYVSPTIAPFVPSRASGDSRRREPQDVTQDILNNASENKISLTDLIGRLDRTVLLGNPGGGKSTAANVIMYEHAPDASRLIPFLVILRDYASDGSPARSIIGHIEYKLETFYQCPAPAGLVARLCLSGRAIIISDGLDELIDTSRRIEITETVENFCMEFPLTKVLVTSRIVGYDQARLDSRQFECYQLAGFNSAQVVDYTNKWFAQDETLSADEASRWAQSFTEESANVADLRSNPLMLALMCILYHGEGSIPHNRPEVYEQCADLLFRKWDTRRRISVELRARHLIEPALRHLAYWLFMHDSGRSAVTESELVRETTAFLHRRGFESEDEAAEASRQFVAFCRGRAWVFSDAGTTASGEILYTFTHRTFLEYFAAADIAIIADTPEKLARTLLPHVAKAEWEVVAELAVQKKDKINDRGAERAITTMLNDRRPRASTGRSNILQFLARCIVSIEVPPRVIREVTQNILTHMTSGDINERAYYYPLGILCSGPRDRCVIIAEELAAHAANMIASEDSAIRRKGLLLVLFQNAASWSQHERNSDRNEDFWQEAVEAARTKYHDKIIESQDDPSIFQFIMHNTMLSFAEVLRPLHGNLTPLFDGPPLGIYGIHWGAYLPWTARSYLNERADQALEDLKTLGQHLCDYPIPPWCGQSQPYPLFDSDIQKSSVAEHQLDSVSYLGLATIVCITVELYRNTPSEFTRDLPIEELVEFLPVLGRYIAKRSRIGVIDDLPELPIPKGFEHTFRSWAEGTINFCSESLRG